MDAVESILAHGNPSYRLDLARWFSPIYLLFENINSNELDRQNLLRSAAALVGCL